MYNQKLEDLAMQLPEANLVKLIAHCPQCDKVASDNEVVYEAGYYVRTIVRKCKCSKWYITGEGH